VFTRFDPLTFVSILALCYLLFWLKLVRWRVILEHLGAKLPSANTRQYYWTSLFWGAITPGRAGEFYRAYPVSQMAGIDISTAIAGSTLDRLFDVLVLFASAAIFVFLWAAGLENWGIWAACSILVVLAAMMFLKHALQSDRLFRNQFVDLRKNIATGLFSLDSRGKLAVLALTVGAYLAFYLATWFLAQVVIPGASAQLVLTAVACGSIVALAPLSISGLGTRDVTLLSIFAASGFQATEVLAFSLGLFGFFNLVALLTGLCYWLLGKKPRAAM
jgi:uncharacterized membrane protein YbhN (UPF0104 family)